MKTKNQSKWKKSKNILKKFGGLMHNTLCYIDNSGYWDPTPEEIAAQKEIERVEAAQQKEEKKNK